MKWVYIILLINTQIREKFKMACFFYHLPSFTDSASMHRMSRKSLRYKMIILRPENQLL